jgi:hypothetical protein
MSPEPSPKLQSGFAIAWLDEFRFSNKAEPPTATQEKANSRGITDLLERSQVATRIRRRCSRRYKTNCQIWLRYKKPHIAFMMGAEKGSDVEELKGQQECVVFPEEAIKYLPDEWQKHLNGRASWIARPGNGSGRLGAGWIF